jgi:thiol-disulfide isomerase/thioredoxin
MTVAEAIASGRPTVVGFITPGLCQTRWCAPVLDSVEAVGAEVGEQANFIHVEVYEDFQELTVVDEMAEWGLTTEPWVFVLDEDGRVVARFNGPLSARELKAALTPLL